MRSDKSATQPSVSKNAHQLSTVTWPPWKLYLPWPRAGWDQRGTQHITQQLGSFHCNQNPEKIKEVRGTREAWIAVLKLGRKLCTAQRLHRLKTWESLCSTLSSARLTETSASAPMTLVTRTKFHTNRSNWSWIYFSLQFVFQDQGS